MDNDIDLDADGKWLTYGELATSRGIDKPSAIKLASRRRWRRRKDNRGTMQVYVPADWLASKGGSLSRDMSVSSISQTYPSSRPLHPDMALDMARAINTMDAAVSTLREQWDREKGRADRAEAEADRAIIALGRAEQRADAAIASERSAIARLAEVETVLQGERKRMDETAKTLMAERTARLGAEAEANRVRAEAGEATQAAATARALLREAAENLTTERTAKTAAAAEVVQLRQAVERGRAEAMQAAQEAEALRAEIAHAAAQAREGDERPAMVASKVDEVQFRRLQEVEQARRSLGRWQRLKRAWRGE
jgi:chromosome segregation ATPase